MRVVIAGAGVAGLTLAKCIKEGGEHEVTILEADEDLGGTWLPRKTYHNLETHGCRAAFVTLPTLCTGFDRLAHASAQDVFHAMHDFKAEHGLQPLITYNSKVTAVEYLADGRVKLNITGKDSLECDFFIQTGSTSVPHIPDFKGQDTFRGKVVAAAEVTTEMFEDIVKKRQNVVVLGGSKAAQDTVFNFAFRGYDNALWVFRRTYWGTNFYHTRVKYMLGPTAGMQAYCRYVLFLVRYLKDSGREGFLSSLLLRFLHRVGFLLSPHPDWNLGNFHGGIFDKARLMYVDRARHERTEIQEMRSDTVILKNGKEVPCDVLICATGYKNEKVPVSTPHGTVLAHQLDATSFFRGFIHPSAPRVAFCNSLTLGNIASDSVVMGTWLNKCFFPLLRGKGDELVKDVLARNAARQVEEMKASRCRPFNLWDPFDRPIQFMYHNVRRFRGEIKDAAGLEQEADSVWQTFSGSFVRLWFYPFAAAAFLLRTTGQKA